MKKTTFTPSPDRLEARIVLSGGPRFSNGAAILTEKALGQTYGLIQKAFDQYANHGQDSGRLQADLAKAVNRIPSTVATACGPRSSPRRRRWWPTSRSNAPAPVQGSRQAALGDVSDFVQGEIAGGVIVMASKVQRTAARVAVPGGPQVSNGAAILTRKALGQTYGQIQKAFSQYANHGRDSGRLQARPGQGRHPHPVQPPRRPAGRGPVRGDSGGGRRREQRAPPGQGCTQRPGRRQRLRPGRDRRRHHRRAIDEPGRSLGESRIPAAGSGTIGRSRSPARLGQVRPFRAGRGRGRVYSSSGVLI